MGGRPGFLDFLNQWNEYAILCHLLMV